MSAIPDVSRFSIYRNPLPVPKRQAERREAESRDLRPLLRRLDEFIKFADVTFGQEPPDFVFHHPGGTIGVELTDLNPKVFEKHGHQQRAQYKSFGAEVLQTSPANAVFDWGTGSMRESLEALNAQLERKIKKAQPWFASFTERWLLMHAASGSPFGKILNGEHETPPGMENELTDYIAKVTHTIYLICREAHPFDHVILFRKSQPYAELLMFASGHSNPYKLPVPREELLSRGAKVSDSLLDQKNTIKTVIETKSFR
jgi:hypothetical protein